MTYPSKICTRCFELVNNFHDYKLNCQSNQKIYKDRFEKLQDIHEDFIIEQHEEIEEIFSPYHTKNDEVDLTSESHKYLADLGEPQFELLEEHYLVEDKIDPQEDPVINNKDELTESDNDEEEQHDRKSSHRKHLELISDEDPKLKGKEIYQKLLTPCTLCGKMIEKNRLEGHVNKHLDSRPFQCKELKCLKTFFCRQLLRLHVSSMHTGQEAMCKECNKSFPSKRSLYTHKLRHKNKDKFRCEICERSFDNSNSLKRHMPSHTGVRDFKCTECHMAFYRKYNLTVHAKTHSKEKNYVCEHCPKRFGYRRLLKMHIQKNHPDEMSNRELPSINSSMNLSNIPTNLQQQLLK